MNQLKIFLICVYYLRCMVFKGIVQLKITIYWKFAHRQLIQIVDKFVSSPKD